MNKAQLLKGVDLFSALSDAQIGQVASTAAEQNYKRGQNIVAQSETSDAFFLIAQGSVKVTANAVGGREVILATLGAGDFFGEMALMDGEPRSATVRTVAKTKLFRIDRESFLKSLRRQPDLALALLAEMSRRLRRADLQISSLALMRVWGRVSANILKLVEERRVRTKTQDAKFISIIHNRPTHKTIAAMSGTTRETVTRVFKLLVQRGAIAVPGNDLVILEESLLK